VAIIKAKAQQSTAVGRVSEGGDVYLRAMRDGALFTADWKQAMIMEGRGFMINVGALSTAVTGGGTPGTAIDPNGPEFVISVPTGTSILPLRVEICSALPVGAADDNEIDILLVADQDSAVTTGTAGTTEVIYNMNTLNSRSSNCTARSEFTAVVTGHTWDLELAHMNKVFEMFATSPDKTGGSQWTELRLLYEPKTPIVLNGPAALVGFWGATTVATAFASVQWLELPSSAI